MAETGRILEYDAPIRSSIAAKVVFVASFFAALTFFLVIPPFVVFAAAAIIRSAILPSDIDGHRRTRKALVISGIALLGAIVALHIPPSAGSNRISARRTWCQANVGGIAKSLSVYAADNNDCYPVVAFAPYASVPNAGPAATTLPENASVAKSMFDVSSPNAGAVQSPDCGQDNDNIFTMSAIPSRGPSQFGGVPAGTAAPKLQADTPSYDTVMLPVRDAATGEF